MQKPNGYDEVKVGGDFTPIELGGHHMIIKGVREEKSKSGKDMLALQFDVSGYSSLIYHYIVFMQNKPEITNRMLTQFFDSFKDISDGEFDTSKWIGKVGACQVKHEEYNDKVNELRQKIKAENIIITVDDRTFCSAVQFSL